MKVHDTGLGGVRLVEPQVFGDDRGSFFESWNRARWRDQGLDFEVVQSNVSESSRGVLRGLHFQWPNPQGKLVGVLHGEVYDVAVDIRRGSPNFGRWTAAVLTAGNRRMLWIPEGYAHGFVVLSERAVFHYLCTAAYSREHDAGIRWDDAQLAIDWPVSAPLLSDKDARLPALCDIDPRRLPTYDAADAGEGVPVAVPEGEATR
jgi:dTDP-4-dehydrorhamnose 3,5-epimerase